MSIELPASAVGFDSQQNADGAEAAARTDGGGGTEEEIVVVAVRRQSSARRESGFESATQSQLEAQGASLDAGDSDQAPESSRARVRVASSRDSGIDSDAQSRVSMNEEEISMQRRSSLNRLQHPERAISSLSRLQEELESSTEDAEVRSNSRQNQSPDYQTGPEPGQLQANHHQQLQDTFAHSNGDHISPVPAGDPSQARDNDDSSEPGSPAQPWLSDPQSARDSSIGSNSSSGSRSSRSRSP